MQKDRTIKKSPKKITGVEQKQNRMNNADSNFNQNGKTEEGLSYSISDVHGMFGSFMEVISKLNPQDTLYICGDVIDRGKYGIKILQEIIKMQNNPQKYPTIKFIIGNHEWLFYKAIKILEKYENPEDIVISIYNVHRLKYILENITRAYKQDEISGFSYKERKTSVENEQYKYSNKLKRLNVSECDIMELGLWLFYNKGMTTISDYLNLNDDEKDKIYKFLESSDVIFSKHIAGKDLLFVHAMPLPDENILKNLKKQIGGYSLKIMWNDKHTMSCLVEERNSEINYKKSLSYGFTTICGHTSTPGEINYQPQNGFIRIDAGCGRKRNNSMLAVYCINTNTVRMLPEREEPLQDPSDYIASPKSKDSEHNEYE